MPAPQAPTRAWSQVLLSAQSSPPRAWAPEQQPLPVRKLQSSLNIRTPTEIFMPESSGAPLLGFFSASFEKLPHCVLEGVGCSPPDHEPAQGRGHISGHILFVCRASHVACTPG